MAPLASTLLASLSRTIPCAMFPLVLAMLALGAPTQITFARGGEPALLPDYIASSLGQYSPYYDVDLYIPPPETCHVDQVNIIQRHGSRFPTDSASKSLEATIAKLQNPQWGLKGDSPLGFLRAYHWDLGSNDLVAFGAKESYDAGSTAFSRYASLLSSSETLPFVRAAGSQRVIESATNWTYGFGTASQFTIIPLAPLIVSEEIGSNNTLNDNNCPAADKVIADAAQAKFAALYFPSITARLSRTVGGTPSSPSLQLTDADTVNLMSMCSYDTVAKGVKSPFCGVFEPEEWPLYEYYQDLGKFYKNGHGHPLGPIQGVGYINELLARLTGTPVKDATNTNTTLTSNPKTFPLDRPLYADFSHDNQIASVVSALGLFQAHSGKDTGASTSLLLPTDRIDEKRKWVFSRIAPFAGRLVVERLQCGKSQGKGSGEAYVRILADNAVQQLDFCEGATAEGLCALGKFVESQGFARSNGDGKWALCSA
ncbi:hypothetical protein BOTBODRAFT_55920 [Botryobasidium botryosum FD-172 SS1]|uniref:Phytase A n=1 Tax=Botryobasidium botryosum (strain FD-172 SS1) TaxID=930990 RepID=A0A067MDM9_BOTB1|nr:hypothetical protein BOTBODRAFT_55920 [Botryobasidium botryosum FD-172 SS1]